jgi:hypothetical protein
VGNQNAATGSESRLRTQRRIFAWLSIAIAQCHSSPPSSDRPLVEVLGEVKLAYVALVRRHRIGGLLDKSAGAVGVIQCQSL